MSPGKRKFDVHQEITNRIVAAIETAGVLRLPRIRSAGGSMRRPGTSPRPSPTTASASSRCGWRRIPSLDMICMPERRRFTGTETATPAEGFYSTPCHELVHRSGAKHRLARDLTGRFGTESHAMEELVAELGAPPLRRSPHHAGTACPARAS